MPFSEDLPFDQFAREQLAGDILAAKSPGHRDQKRIIATGFLALSRRYATAPYELWHLSLEDSVDTFGRAFLGLTLRCARCHDHKFDPVTTADYYSLYGIFASTQYPWAGGEEFQSKQFNRQHFVPLLPAAELEPLRARHAEQVKKLQEEIAALEKEGQAEPAKRLRSDLRNLERRGLPEGAPGAYAVREGKPVNAPIQLQGDPAAAGDVAPRGVPRFLSAGEVQIPADESGRAQLAEWLTRPEHPLTARVIANRVWQHHFGKGLVATPSNFGLRGAPPTHPELLDFLARYLVEHEWSLKALHRLIVTSRTYRLASDSGELAQASLARDPVNRWYWRHDRRRLDAEAIRDGMMFVAGTLDLRRPGEHPFPHINNWNWTQHSPFKDVYPSPHRSVYLMTQRFQRHPFLALFDGPDTNTSTDVRSSSIVPLQALYLMNSPQVQNEAEAFARRLTATSSDETQRIVTAHELAYSRPPTEAEVAAWQTYLTRYRQALPAETPPQRGEIEPWVSLARVLLSGNEFVFVE
jgi:hypothetical protein